MSTVKPSSSSSSSSSVPRFLVAHVFYNFNACSHSSLKRLGFKYVATLDANANANPYHKRRHCFECVNDNGVTMADIEREFRRFFPDNYIFMPESKESVNIYDASQKVIEDERANGQNPSSFIVFV
jgi:hypothetical protein